MLNNFQCSKCKFFYPKKSDHRKPHENCHEKPQISTNPTQHPPTQHNSTNLTLQVVTIECFRTLIEMNSANDLFTHQNSCFRSNTCAVLRMRKACSQNGANERKGKNKIFQKTVPMTVKDKTQFLENQHNSSSKVGERDPENAGRSEEW